MNVQGGVFGFFPEWRWRDHLLVDGWAYQTKWPRLLFVDGYDVLCHTRSCWVLERIFCEDSAMFETLRETYKIPRYAHELDTLEEVEKLLGITFTPFEATVNRFARLIIFERKRPKVVPRPEPERARYMPAPLSAKSSWVSIECVDSGEPPLPVANVPLEIVTASTEVRNARSDREGTAFIDAIAPGRVTIRVLGMDGAFWRPLEGDGATPSGRDERFTWHQVQRGECLSGIAHRYGLEQWQEIWEFRLNQALREKRKSPHVLHPGDMLAVPAVQLCEIYRSTEATHRIVVERGRVRRGYVLDARDLRFHSGSGVLLAQYAPSSDPDVRSDAPGIDALASTLLHAQEHPARSLLLAGHSDTTETPEGERKLSEARASTVRHMLRGERDAWVALVREHSCAEDLPAILRWCAEARGWACAPAEEEGADPGNERALRAFQTSYNRNHDASIAEDGVLGPQTWGAVFDVYQQQLAQTLETDAAGLEALQGSLRFCAAAESYGCGSALAVHAGPRTEAAEYRRTDVLFFEPGEEPAAADLELGPLAEPDFAFTPIPLRRAEPRVARFESELALNLTTALAQQLTPGGFAHWGRTVFGEQIGRAAFEALQRDLRAGTLAPAEVSVEQRLNGHPAAYDSSRRAILVTRKLVMEARHDRTGKAAALACMLVEEFGHFLDDSLRHHYAGVGGDAPQDEGALFAYLLLAQPFSESSPFRVGTLNLDETAYPIDADPRELSELAREVLGAIQRQTDEREGSLEYADALPGNQPSNQPRDVDEADEILYLNLLVAGYQSLDSHALVDLACRLNERWRGTSGPAVFYETHRPGKAGLALERLILTHLLRLHAELQRRIDRAPLAADGMPDLGSPTPWKLEAEESLWQPGSPLGGLLEDIAPFGSHQEWIARFSELAMIRPHHEAGIRRHAREVRDAPVPKKSVLDPGPLPELNVNVPSAVSEPASGKAGGTPILDAIDRTDQLAGAVGTVLEILEVFSVEVAGSVAVSVVGPLLSVASFLSTMLRADGQQAAAAKAMGVVFAYFTVSKFSRMKTQPIRVLEQDVEHDVQMDTYLKRLREQRETSRWTTPKAVLDKAEKEGVQQVLDALSKNLSRVPALARRAYEDMMQRADDPLLLPKERQQRIYSIAADYPQSWWDQEIRRAVYIEFADRIKTQALAAFERLK
jgi:hypothetical protein